MARPLLLLDVDGVVALRQPSPTPYVEQVVVSSTGARHAIWVNPDHGPWIRDLAQVFDVVWATGWEHDAPRLLGSLLDVPAFPVLEFTERPRLGSRFAKLPDVHAFVAQRSVAWVDDDLDVESFAWAMARKPSTLILQPSAAVGLELAHVFTLLDFADSLGGERTAD